MENKSAAGTPGDLRKRIADYRQAERLHREQYAANAGAAQALEALLAAMLKEAEGSAA